MLRDFGIFIALVCLLISVIVILNARWVIHCIDNSKDLENKMVDKVTINVKGKLIYINVYLNSGKKEDAQSIAIKSLDLLTDEEKEFYDINFTFSKESKSEQEASFIMMGYKKSDATIISWTKDNGE